MTPRENYFANLNYDNPAYVPYEPHITWSYLEERHSEEALKPLKDAAAKAPVDFAVIQPGEDPAYKKKRTDIPEGFAESEWGCVFRINLPYITEHPLADGWHLLDDYPMPDPYAPGRFDGRKEIADEARDTRYLRAWGSSALWERIWIIRGYENALQDVYLEPDNLAKLRDMIVDYQVGIMEQFHEIGVDGIYFTDDWGTQTSTMILPEIWRDFFKPAYAKIFEAARANDTHVWYHSDGNIMEIIPDLIDVGVKVLNPIQPDSLDINKVVAKFGKKLCYSGGIDVQHTLPFGTPDEVRAQTRQWIDLSHQLGGGMFIAPTNLVTPETPLENLMAYLETCQEFCGAPIDE